MAPADIRIETVPLGRFHRPSEGDTFPGIVFVHDVMGLSDHSRALSSDLAREGFGVLELALYRRLGEVEIADPGAMIRSLSDEDVLADIEAGADWLRGESPGCRGRKVGLVGTCMGGTFTILAACLSDRFDAAAPFYGLLSYDDGLIAGGEGRDRARKPISPIEAAPRLRTPMLASFGAEDDFVPERDVAAFEAAVAASGVACAIDRYPGAGHAFLNRTREAAWRPEASAAAWARIVPFLHAELD